MQNRDFLYNLNDRINNIYSEIDELKQSIDNSNSKMLEVCKIMQDLYEKMSVLDKQTDNSTHKALISPNNLTIQPKINEDKTNRHIIQTDNEQNETNRQIIQTNTSNIKPLNDQILPISIGNRGVQTDRQTDQQTDKNVFDDALNTLNSLDSVKKELRLKFKRLTNKELLVFSTIYQLEEEFGFSSYRSIANKLSLTESSIRDYIRRLIDKEVPIIKEKINNKEIRLFISPKLRSVVSLQTILQLRDL